MLLYESLAVFLGLLLTTSPRPVSASPSPSPSPSSSSSSNSKPLEPCTARSPHSGAFFDLNGLNIPNPATSGGKKGSNGKKSARDHSWNATGWDMGYNFTMNFCGPVVEDLADLGGVEGVEKELWGNVSAYYKTAGGKIYSIGLQNAEPVVRGRKLVLNYTDGSPCGSDRRRLATREIVDDDDDDDDDEDNDDKKSGGKKPSSGAAGRRRKSTIISMLCEKDPLHAALTLSFVGASPDECTYFFEARSNAACAGIEKATQSLGPGGVFGVIVLIAFIVYIVGGCVYSRVVLQQRGWRQLPNYALWAGVGGFLKDVFIILTSSCARFLPSRRGYSRVNGGFGSGGIGGGGGGRGGRDSDAENRLIDELNEEWDD